MTLRKKKKQTRMLKNGRYIRIGVGALLGLIILGYGASKSVNLIVGPQLQIESPTNGETVREPFLIIKGSAKNVAFLSLNDKQIFIDDQGDISDQILLYEGYNIITAKAKDKFGREKIVTREIVYIRPDDRQETSDIRQ